MSFALPHRAATNDRFCRDERGAGVAQFSRPGPDGPAHGGCGPAPALLRRAAVPDAGMTAFVSLFDQVVPDSVGWSRLDGLARQDDAEGESAGGKSGIQKAAGKEATDAPKKGRKGHCSDRGKQAR